MPRPQDKNAAAAPDPGPDAEVAVAAAIAGAAVVRARFGTALQRIEKAPLDFATDADVAAERAILDVLRAARPGDGYQGQELGESGAGRSGRRWLIDPLCGTANFAVTTPLTAVNVALCAGDRVLAAAARTRWRGRCSGPTPRRPGCAAAAPISRSPRRLRPGWWR